MSCVEFSDCVSFAHCSDGRTGSSVYRASSLSPSLALRGPGVERVNNNRHASFVVHDTPVNHELRRPLGCRSCGALPFRCNGKATRLVLSTFVVRSQTAYLHRQNRSTTFAWGQRDDACWRPCRISAARPTLDSLHSSGAQGAASISHQCVSAGRQRSERKPDHHLADASLA